MLAILIYVLLPTGDGGLSQGGRATVAIGRLMAVWWVTEGLPLAATALLPIALFPVTGVLSMEDATAPYANDLIFPTGSRASTPMTPTRSPDAVRPTSPPA